MTRHRPADAVRIDLDDGEPDVPEGPRRAGSGEAGPVPPGERPASGNEGGEGGEGTDGADGRAWRRPRVLATTAGVLALLVGGGFVMSALRGVALADRLRDAPGGVLTLEHEPVAAWERSADVGAVLSVPGAIVFPSGTALVALDPASGETRWTVASGPDAVCGPVDVYAAASPAVDPVVCVHGAGDRTVTVVTAAGEVVAERPVAAGSSPGPAGTVVRAQRVGAPVPDPDASVTCVDRGCTFEGSVDRGRDVELRAEDAVTGEERWTWRVPFEPADVPDCVPWLTDGPLVVDPELTRVEAAPGFVRVVGCGIRAVFSADGQRLDAPGAGRRVEVDALPGGGFVVRGAIHDVVVDGAAGRELPGRLLLPGATDGSYPGVLLIDLGTRVRAEDRDGRELWTMPVPAARLLVQTAGIALLDDGAGNVGAVDLGTGTELWRQTRLDDAAGLDRTAWAPTIEQAFTDGHRALVTMSGIPGADVRVLYAVAVDLRTGRIEWGARLSGLDRLLAVDGRLVGAGEGRLVGLVTRPHVGGSA